MVYVRRNPILIDEDGNTYSPNPGFGGDYWHEGGWVKTPEELVAALGKPLFPLRGALLGLYRAQRDLEHWVTEGSRDVHS